MLGGLGAPILGVETNNDACASRYAAGYATWQQSVTDVTREQLWSFARYGVEGLIASPPCTAFSAAGKREGVKYADAIVDAVRAGNWALRPSEDPNVWLVLEVGRWVETLMPRWVALEQVPAVRPIWEAYAARWKALGYNTWVGICDAVSYGVPQRRKRAILVASMDRAVAMPPITHEKSEWVTMAEALGFGMTERPAHTLAPGTARGGADYGGGQEHEPQPCENATPEDGWIVNTRGKGGPVAATTSALTGLHGRSPRKHDHGN